MVYCLFHIQSITLHIRRIGHEYSIICSLKAGINRTYLHLSNNSDTKEARHRQCSDPKLASKKQQNA